MVIAKGADVLPLGIAHLIVEPDHYPAALALGLKAGFLEFVLVPPVNPFAGLFGKGDVIEGQGHVKRVQSRSESFGQAGLAEFFCILALVGAVNPAKILFPEGVPGAFDVGGRTDGGSTLANPKIGGYDVSFDWE